MIDVRQTVSVPYHIVTVPMVYVNVT